MSKKGKLVNKVMDNIDSKLAEKGLDDDYEWYYAKKTSISDDPIILIEFPDGVTRGFDVEWEERDDDDWKAAAELVTVQIMQAINQFEETRYDNRSTRPIINHEVQEDLLIDRYEQSFDEDAYMGGELEYELPSEDDYYFDMADDDIER